MLFLPQQNRQVSRQVAYHQYLRYQDIQPLSEHGAGPIYSADSLPPPASFSPCSPDQHEPAVRLLLPSAVILSLYLALEPAVALPCPAPPSTTQKESVDQPPEMAAAIHPVLTVPGHKTGKFPRSWGIDSMIYEPYTPPEKDFYSTDYFTNYAIDYLEEYKDESKPFFLYLAYTAPHDPLMAWYKTAQHV